MTAPDLAQTVARLRRRRDILTESGSQPVRPCANRPAADARVPTPCAQPRHDDLIDLGAVQQWASFAHSTYLDIL